MILNTVESIKKIKSLLDEYNVYKYDLDTELIADINVISNEVYINDILKIVTPTQYLALQATTFSEYTVDDTLLFYVECYTIAGRFLQAWSLKNETELQKTTYDYNTGIKGEEKSGKLYTAQEYLRIAATHRSCMSPEYGKEYSTSRISIARY